MDESTMNAARAAQAAANVAAPAHCREAGAVVSGLGSDAAVGLAAAEAARRLQTAGANELAVGRTRGPLRMVMDQVCDPLILVLVAAALVAGLIGELVDTVVILAIVVLNAVAGFVQEYRAERAIAALRRLAAPSARVLRDGAASTIAAAELVPGDIVFLEAGNVVPADLRLLSTHVLRCDESALTGESVPVDKHEHPLEDPGLVLGDRRNIAYKATLVTHGRGQAVVIATGMQSELGKLAALLGATPDGQTPLQQRLARFGRVVGVGIVLLSLALFALGVLRGENLLLMALTAISLAVAAIPESLPAVVTVALALGARRLSGQQALIRRLPAVETLGSVTWICSDKTGTLTENRMRVEVITVAGVESRRTADGGFSADVVATAAGRECLRAMLLCNDASRDASGELTGDPTETALHATAEAAGLVPADEALRLPRIAELPFAAERACMSTLHRDAADVLVYLKGAPERVLPLCRTVLGAAGEEPLDRELAAALAERLAAQGLRVLALARRRLAVLPERLDAGAIEAELVLLGFAGLLDPPRPEAAAAVAMCQAAGITPVMITGDHPATARAIAVRVGIEATAASTLTGQELARMDAAELHHRVRGTRVFARVAPEQKIRIVEALQAHGEWVAMTGDGVNDAPALKRADIGVAMGRAGTDVAKEAAHMVLLDDNFATIVKAVREGRRIYDNLRKFVRYVMTGNLGELLTLTLGAFAGLPIPLLPIHILWVNLVTDGLPGLALTVEPAEPGVMQRPPRPPAQSLFADGLWQHLLAIGLLIGAICIGLQHWALAHAPELAQTMVFTVLTTAQLFHVLAVRSERESLFTLGLLSNRPLLGAVLFSFALQLATVYVPACNPVFRTQPLPLAELAACIGLAALVLLAVEAEKWGVRRGLLYAGRRESC